MANPITSRDWRNTKGLYERAVRQQMVERGVSRKTVVTDPTFQNQWQTAKDAWKDEAAQHQAYRDFVLAERFRAGRLTTHEYFAALQEGRTTQREREEGFSRYRHPLTQADYEAVLRQHYVNRSPTGPFARALVMIGIREASWTWDVGDTPEIGTRSA